jgi:NAD(P)-dependent dehydrogenase (short-subunit alcohol dehydrogenase family)
MPATEIVGEVALIIGGGEEVGAAIARSLSARGVSVVISGRDEHALGRVVGEIAASGGKARHLKGDARDLGHLLAAIEKAISAFGHLAIVVTASSDVDACATFRAALPTMKNPGTFLAVTPSSGFSETDRANIGAVASEAASRKITCNAIAFANVESEEIAEIAAFLCMRAATAISGQTIGVGVLS